MDYAVTHQTIDGAPTWWRGITRLLGPEDQSADRPIKRDKRCTFCEIDFPHSLAIHAIRVENATRARRLHGGSKSWRGSRR